MINVKISEQNIDKEYHKNVMLEKYRYLPVRVSMGRNKHFTNISIILILKFFNAIFSILSVFLCSLIPNKKIYLSFINNYLE